MLNKIRSLNSLEEIKKELSSCKKSELLVLADELQLIGVKNYSKVKLINQIAETQKLRIDMDIINQVNIKSSWQM